MIPLATINLLLGVISLFLVTGVALGALAYAVEGIRGRGFRRLWKLFVALLLGAFASSTFATMGQNFARASDPTLRGMSADTLSVVAVFFWTLASLVILVAGTKYFRGMLQVGLPGAHS